MTIIVVRADALARAFDAITLKSKWFDDAGRLRDPSRVLVAQPEGVFVCGGAGRVLIRAPVDDATIEEPGIFVLCQKLRDGLRPLGEHALRIQSQVVDEGTAAVTYESDHGAHGEYEADRRSERLYSEEKFAGGGRESVCTARVLRLALEAALPFVSVEEGDTQMRFGGISLVPGRVLASHNHKAIIIESRELPRVKAWLRHGAVLPLVRFLASQGDVVSVSASRERVRVTGKRSGAVFVTDSSGVRPLGCVEPPSAPPVFAFEALTKDFERTIGFLQTGQAPYVRATVGEDGRSFGLTFQAPDGMKGYGPAFGSTWTGSPESIPWFPLAALELVLAGLKGDRAKVEFRFVGDTVLLTSEEHVAEKVKSKKKPAPDMTITRCVMLSRRPPRPSP